jgi:membrane-associated phospholipid phosphatase
VALPLLGFAALTAALAAGHLLGLDLAVRDWCAARRPPVPYWTARSLNLLGQGGALTTAAALLAGAVAVRAGTVRGLLPVAAAFVLTTGTVLPLKLLTDRTAPANPRPDAAELFNTLADGENGRSYPAGHVVVAVVWYAVLAMLIDALLRAYRRDPLPTWARRAIQAGPAVIVLGTTTYLGFHWLTDGLGGLLLGGFLVGVLRQVPWDRIALPRPVGRWAGPLP